MGLRPIRPKLFWAKGVFGKRHHYVFPFYFAPLCFDMWLYKFFLDVRKFQKNLRVFFDLFMGLSYFFFSCFFVDFVVYSICGLLL